MPRLAEKRQARCDRRRGPASLASRATSPAGYHCIVFDSDPKAGGMMRTQIPNSGCRIR